MGSVSFKEFKPTIFFLVKFVGLYLVGNLLYGWYVTHYEPKPDPVTHVVARQTAGILSFCGWPVTIYDYKEIPTTSLLYEGRSILAVYEGCNGLNTAIIFAAFIIAFGPVSRAWAWFIPLGLLIIHSMNLARIAMLFFVSEYLPNAMYFVHKYLFTAILYAIIFILWVWWVRRFSVWKEKT